MASHLGVWRLVPSLSYTPKIMRCDFQASFLARTLASRCFGHEPKAKVVTYLMMLCFPFNFCCVSSWFQINNLLTSFSQAMKFSQLLWNFLQIVHLWNLRNKFHLWLKDWSSQVNIIFLYQQVFHYAKVPYQYHLWWCTNDFILHN